MLMICDNAFMETPMYSIFYLGAHNFLYFSGLLLSLLSFCFPVAHKLSINFLYPYICIRISLIKSS